MRRTFLLIQVLILSLVSACSRPQTVRQEELVFSETDRVHYRKGETQPFNGVVVKYDGDHVIQETTYRDGKENGPYTRWELISEKQTGLFRGASVRKVKKAEGFFKNNALDGKNITRHYNGSVAYVHFYRDGRMDGEQTGYSKDGTLTYKSLFRNGTKVGEELHWTAAGKLKEKTVWSNGKIVEANYYFSDGTLRKAIGFTEKGDDTTDIREWDAKGEPIVHHKETYANGKTKKRYSVKSNGQLEGNYEEYHENGKLKISVKYTNGNRHGWYTERYDNRNIKVSAEYWDGTLDRQYQEYDADGSLRLVRDYKKGILKSEKKYEKK